MMAPAARTPFRRVIAGDPEEPCREEYYGMKPTVRGGEPTWVSCVSSAHVSEQPPVEMPLCQ